MRLVLTLIAALLLFAPAGAHAQSAPPGFFGVMADGVLMTRDDASFASEFRVMKATGVESVRPVVYWADMQPEPHGPVVFTSLDRLMGEAARNGISVLPVVLRAPAWARKVSRDIGSHPKDPADYAAFLTALVGRYGPAGSFWAEHPELPKRPQRTWEVWNEPNLQRYWSPSIVRSRASAREFVELTHAASAAIRAADPGARVVLSSFGEAGAENTSWDAIDIVFRAGLERSSFDAVAGHPFSGRVANVVKIVKLDRRAFSRHGAGRTPMIISELSWPSAKGKTDNFTTGFETTEKGQATKLRNAYRSLLRLRSRYRIESVFWSTWLTADCCSSNNFDWAGLRKLDRRNPAGDPIDKPALRAFRGLARR
jgi:hypothetical protein